MHLIHLTHWRNITSVGTQGLLLERSQGPRPRVWLAEPMIIEWLTRHISAHHCWEPDNLRVVTVNVPNSILTVFPTIGVYYANRDIAVREITGVHLLSDYKRRAGMPGRKKRHRRE